MDFLYVDGVLVQGRLLLFILALALPIGLASVTAYLSAAGGDDVDGILLLAFGAFVAGVVVDLFIALLLYAFPLWLTIVIALSIAVPAFFAWIGRKHG